MPSCAAQGCSNSWKTGHKMCYFPIKDKKRCAVWVHNMNHTNWIPSKNSTLCQIHFAPEMWEKRRADGSLKLKINAIPTLFDKTVAEDPIARQIENKKDLNFEINNEPMEYEDVSMDEYEDTNEIININIENEKDVEDVEDGTSVQSNTALNSCANCLEKDKKLEEMHKLVIKVDRLHKHAKQKLFIAKRNIKRLQRQINSTNTLALKVRQIFNDTQLKLLSDEI